MDEAENQVQNGFRECLKEFAASVTSSKVGIHRKVFTSLMEHLDKAQSTEMQDAVVKGILKLLVPAALYRYQQIESRRLAQQLILDLVRRFPAPAVSSLSDLLTQFFSKFSDNIGDGTAKCGLLGLKWLCSSVKSLNKSVLSEFSNSCFKSLTLGLMNCLFVASSCKKKSHLFRIQRCLFVSWKGDSSRLVREKIVENIPQDSSRVLPLLSYLVLFGKTGDKYQFLAPENLALDLYVKLILSSKTAPSQDLLITCRPIVRLISHEKFESVILPSIKKSMLRSPEVAIHAVAIMLSQLSIDLSKYAVDLLKLVGAQLHSKEESMVQKGIESVAGLAAQCSDWEVVRALLKHLFGILNGSEGKLGIASQKIGVLKGISALSGHKISGTDSVETVSTEAVEGLAPILKEEIHEGTLCVALECLTAWAKRFKNQAPTALIGCIKEGMTSKKSASSIKFEYLRCLNNSLNTNTLSNAIELNKILLASMEAGIKQPNQAPLVTESVIAALLLLKLSRISTEIDSKLELLWGAINDKGVFTSKKFLISLNDEGMDCLSELLTRIILEYSHKLPVDGVPQDVCKALLVALTYTKYSVRQRTSERIRKILGLLEGARFSQAMLKALESSVVDGWLVSTVKDIRAKSLGDEEEKKSPENESVLLRALLQKAILSVTNFETPPDEMGCRETAGAALIPSVVPVLNEQGDAWLWVGVLRRLNLDPIKFVGENIAEISRRLKQCKDIQVKQNAIFALSEVDADLIWKGIVRSEIEAIPVEKISTISELNMTIALTQEGTLYDTSVIEKAADEAVTKGGNVKRESKTYSYKEQKMEMELRKELEEKKRREGKGKELTPKQKQAIKEQLGIEAEIRREVLEISAPINDTLKLVKAALEGNLNAGRFRLPEILDSILPLCRFEILSRGVVDSWLTLRKAAFPESSEQIFGNLVGNCSLRLIKSAGGIDEGWTRESIAVQAARCVRGLYELTYGPGNRQSTESSEYDDELELDEELGKRHPLPLFTFTYCIPLLKSVLVDRPGLFTEQREEMSLMALKLVKIQLNPDSIESEDLTLVPMETVSKMLIRLISESDPGPVQQLASGSLLCVGSVVERFWKDIGFDPEPLMRSLMTSLVHPDDIVREYAFQTLINMKSCLSEMIQLNSDLHTNAVQRLWVGKHDTNSDCRSLATELWCRLGLHLDKATCGRILEDVMNNSACIREAASEALNEALKVHVSGIRCTLKSIGSLYEKKAEIPPPVFDEVGRMISDGNQDDTWEARAGLALSLREISVLVPSELVGEFFAIIVPKGVNDRRVEVRDLMLQAAVEGVKDHGGGNVNMLLDMFETLLDDVPDGRSYDILRQSLVVLLGTLARHLNPEESAEKIRLIVARLIETLSTPSQQVQESVAQCLPPLIQSVKDQAQALSHQLLHLLLEAEQYGERRGAAYGIAGLVKGMGMISMKKLEIMATLQEALGDKKVARHREGALLALEMLCMMLGKLFDPYVVTILPNLLLSLGDHDPHVRKAAEDCSKAVMKQLSAHGVKLVLPSLLAGLEEDSWRTKCGSIELLGAMAYCAPKQLSACLPSIVPKLIEVLSDTHMKVQKTGEQALKQIGKVIRNPEIQAITGVLLSALMDPANKTAASLQTLLKTKFVHYIDAPSLALLMPVIKRAFDDRSTETRRMAAQIIGNIFSLTDQKDVEPYLDQLLPGLKKSLTDPVPEVRAVSARALGAIVETATGDVAQGLKEDLLPWLKEKLVAEQNPVDRSGAAQGLSEVFGALGRDQLQRIMPDIIQTAESTDVAPHVKDGYIMLFVYLPGVFKEEFVPYLSRVIPSILKALADEKEFVRETALKAGQRLINMYCETAITLLLPQLERGLFDDNWRIRYSSVQLVGDFLFRISGVSGKMTTSSAGDDDTFGTESSQKIITNSLGVEERNRVFSGLYIARSDVALLVRQASAHVWKVVVANTPRTLKEILPTMFSLLLGCLASSSDDKKQTAARCLGDLVRKMGDRVLVDIVPVLEEGLKSDVPDQRQGVCVALSEIMSNTTKDMIMLYIDSLVPTVRTALYDPLPEIREAAASTFDVLHTMIGTQALDEVLTPLLAQLSDPKHGEFTLHGLQKVMAVKSRVVLPYLVPKLTAPPVNTKALSQLAAVSGDALGRHMSTVLEAMLAALADAINQSQGESEEMDRCLNVVLSVSDHQGVTAVVDSLLKKSVGGNKEIQLASVRLLADFCQKTKANLIDYAARLMEGFLALYSNEKESVVLAAIDGLSSVTKSLDAREQLDFVFTIKQAIRTVAKEKGPGEKLEGFCYPKGLQPVLPILREGVLNGGPEIKEAAAETLGETIKLSDPVALKPHVVNMTGPLIRVLGDRYSPGVKTTILNTLAMFLEKVEVMLKPFLPQLQSTFLKALQEPASKSVRLSAGKALSKLIYIHPKPDNIVLEILKNLKTVEDSAIRETFLVGLRGVIEGGKSKFSQDSKNQCLDVLLEELRSVDDSCRVAAGAALGAVVAEALVDEEQFASVVGDFLLDSDHGIDWEQRHGQGVALQVALKLGPAKFGNISEERLRKAILTYIAADRVPVTSAGLRSAGFWLAYQLKSGSETDTQLLTAVSRAVNHQSNDVKLLSGTVVHYLGDAIEETPDMGFLKVVVPMMVNGTKEKNSGVRCSCEEALMAVLKLRKNQDIFNNYCNSVDPGAKGALTDVYQKSLAKLAKSAVSVPAVMDNTVQIV